MKSHGPTAFMARLAELENRLEILEAEDSDSEESFKRQEEGLLTILTEACTIAWEAEESSDPHLKSIITKVDGLINKAVDVAFQGPEPLFDFIPSFAHSSASPLVQDETEDNKFGQSVVTGFMAAFGSYLRLKEGGLYLNPSLEELLRLPVAWNAATKPHPCTTPLARFRPHTAPISPTTADVLANTIYQARCEISCTSVCSPVRLVLSPDASCLSLTAAGGYKNRSPVLSYWRLDNDNIEFPKNRNIEVGLADIPYHSAMDARRRLVFVADEDRIKSFVWASPSEHSSGGGHGHSGLPVHTLDSSDFSGPLHVVNDHVFRAGHGSAAMWRIDALENHGPQGNTPIGETIDMDDERRAESEEIERSSGSAMNEKIQFDDVGLRPWLWHNHPSKPGTMLCVSDPDYNKLRSSFSCVAVELETGKTSDRYIGHSAEVLDISTSESDPDVFVTACDDGYARLYDTRHHLPILTIDVGQQGDACPAAIICHPNGIPTLFTGSKQREIIKLWDVRARSPVFELATGNNAVASMAWDSTRSSLYAATECNYVDRLGYSHGYRGVKMPESGRSTEATTRHLTSGDPDEDDSEGSDGDEWDDDDDDDDDTAWPKQAFHAEDYFGYTFDSGEHRIYRYQFKADADITVLPPDGGVTVP